MSSVDGAAKGRIKRFRDNFQAEIDAATIYRALADREADSERALVFRKLADAEDRHAGIWIEKLRQMEASPPRAHPTFRARTIASLTRRFGTNVGLPFMTAMEKREAGSLQYSKDAREAGIAVEDRTHSRVMDQLSGSVGPGAIAQMEGWHRSGGSGTLRAAVFGINDGLVSNFGLVIGVAAADPEPDVVILAGFAGLLAGAFSMAAGEFISMLAQRELFEKQINLEEDELEASPEEEEEELILIYQAKGVPEGEARSLAQRIMSDKATALDTLVREELGLDPNELGSPTGAAASSFLSFGVGALLPLIPFLFLSGWEGIITSAVVAGVALFTVGAALSLFTGREPLWSGARMLIIGAVAAIVTYSLGSLIGANTNL
ncbi:MAG TPA: VIT1/CCC1 transporter family protein [Dehalococcoidia bacterium]|nr:VIT1/CCC1 transporter family protein [Dehalococcoidia bacterium]